MEDELDKDNIQRHTKLQGIGTENLRAYGKFKSDFRLEKYLTNMEDGRSCQKKAHVYTTS